MTTLPVIAAWLGLANLVTYCAFGWDKRRARRGGRRVPEARLLLFALAGGTPGAFLARKHFRHKTRKQPFLGRLRAIAVVQGLAIVAVCWWAFEAMPLSKY